VFWFNFSRHHYFEEILNTLGDVKESIGGHVKNYTHLIVDESIHLLESLEESEIVKDLHQKLYNLKEGIVNLLDEEVLYSGEGTQYIRRWPLFIFLASAIICLGFSAVFHLFSALGKETNNFLNRMDYAGISILIAGSCYPPYFYFLYCEPFKDDFNI
jgi:adiponectin receptor